MRTVRGFLYAFVLIVSYGSSCMKAESPQGADQVQGSGQSNGQATSDIPTYRVSSSLVFLDVTVLDKQNKPVTSGLTQDDFSVTDAGQAEKLFSFEGPDAHIYKAPAASSDLAAKTAKTIFVLDLLDSTFADFAWIRQSMRKYFNAQPVTLSSPSELVVLDNDELLTLQTSTRSKADLLDALDHVPTELNYKRTEGAFRGERLYRSVNALQQIALQNQGIQGRKNIIWLGEGSPNLRHDDFITSAIYEKVNKLIRKTTNMLVEGRISLFLIYAQPPGSLGDTFSENSSTIDTGVDDPFAADVSFGTFVNETGGALFHSRNDLDEEIRQSQQLGSQYYTLTYTPKQEPSDGKFHRIRVTMRDPSLRAFTKTGYYVLGKEESPDPIQKSIVTMATAVRATVPLDSVSMSIEDLKWHPDTDVAQFTVVVNAAGLDWHPDGDGKSATKVTFEVASMNRKQVTLVQKLSMVTLIASTQDPVSRAKALIRLPISVRVPANAVDVRLIMESLSGGQLGAAQLDRAMLASAPRSPTPEPTLIQRDHH